MSPQETLQRTPLYDEHLVLGARMVPFSGWEMPVQYEGILSEHKATREACAIFDISHMGEFVVEGDCKASGLDRIVTMKLVDCPVKACRYGCMVNDKGGVIDDLIVFREEENKWFIVVNGATAQKDAAHFRKHLTDQGSFKDISSKIGKIDVQGPKSREILSSFVANIGKLDYYTFDYFDLLGEHVLVSRTGYTGELGYEIYYPWDKTVDLWRALLQGLGVTPAGLGARDILRIEMGYSLYGHELGEDISPLQSGLARFIDFEKEFIGRDVLLKEKEKGIRRKIVGIKSASRKAPREGNRIVLASGEEVGTVTSGTFSPSLNRGVALGFVAPEHGAPDTPVRFGDGKNTADAVIAPRTFYKNGTAHLKK